MRKEVFFAIITGAALGLVVAFGVWRANGAIKNGTVNSTSPFPSARPIQSSIPTPTATVGQISLLSPLQQEVITTDTVNITGTTKANAWVVMVLGSKVALTQSDATGAFTHSMSIPQGLSLISVTAFEKTGQVHETSALIVGTSSIQASTTTPPPQSSDSVRAKIEQANAKPTAYIGTVTDKTDAGVQIKSIQGEIKQATIVQSAEVVRLGSTNKTLQFADVAIGDFIVAIGYKNATDVLDTKRVYVTASPSANSKPVFGTVARLSKKDLDLRGTSAEITPIVSTSDLVISLVGEGSKLTTKKFSDIKMADSLIKADKNIFIVATTAAATATPKASASPKATPKPSATPKI